MSRSRPTSRASRGIPTCRGGSRRATKQQRTGRRPARGRPRSSRSSYVISAVLREHDRRRAVLFLRQLHRASRPGAGRARARPRETSSRMPVNTFGLDRGRVGFGLDHAVGHRLPRLASGSRRRRRRCRRPRRRAAAPSAACRGCGRRRPAPVDDDRVTAAGFARRSSRPSIHLMRAFIESRTCAFTPTADDRRKSACALRSAAIRRSCMLQRNMR